MQDLSYRRPSIALALFLAVGGFVVGLAAWSLPVNLKSVSPALLRAAGAQSRSLAAFGRDLVDSEKIGPAALLLAASQTVGDPRAPALERSLEELTARQPALAAWGGWDPFLDPLFNLRASSGRAASTPVLTFFLPQAARDKLRVHLSGSGSIGVQALMQLREITSTGRFVPAARPGGQPLDSLILLTGLLYQGEHLSPPLQRELRALAETAVTAKNLGELEPFFMDLLSLGRRLDWVQLSELLRRTTDAKTVSAYAHLARVAPDELPLIYSAALFADSSDRVASYLIQYGKAGAEDLRLALSQGQGAVRVLLDRQVPVNRQPAPAIGALGEFAFTHPQLTLGLKYLGYLVGAFLVLRALDLLVTRTGPGTPLMALPRMKAGVLALLFAALLVVGTEPFLLKAAPPSEYQVRVHFPVLFAVDSTSTPPASPSLTMDSSTIISILLFASLQVGMYFICLVKIREIAGQDVSPLVRLRLIENEENLFDGGLYLGIGGTATALVLQVLGVIEPNLLAAYSSNLFGITCVALVKIRHVRPFKRELILVSQNDFAAKKS